MSTLEATTRRDQLAAVLQRVPTRLLIAEIERRHETHHVMLPATVEAREAMVEMSGTYARQIHAAARAWGLDPQQLFCRTRHPQIVNARMAAMGLLRKAGLSFPEIGKVMHMHHSSAMHAIHNLGVWKRYQKPEYERYLVAQSLLVENAQADLPATVDSASGKDVIAG